MAATSMEVRWRSTWPCVTLPPPTTGSAVQQGDQAQSDPAVSVARRNSSRKASYALQVVEMKCRGTEGTSDMHMAHEVRNRLDGMSAKHAGVHLAPQANVNYNRFLPATLLSLFSHSDLIGATCGPMCHISAVAATSPRP